MPAESLFEFEDGEIEAPHKGRAIPTDDSDEDIGQKRKHKKKEKDKDKDKEERAIKRHKEHKKSKKHKKDKDDGSSSEEKEKVNGDTKESAREERPHDSPVRPRDEEKRKSPERSPPRRAARSRSPRKRSRSPDRRRSPPRRRSPARNDRRRSPPRGYGGYNDRGRGGGGYRDNRRDDRRDDRRGGDRRGMTEERRQDELRKEKEREAEEVIRKQKEDEEYEKSVAAQFERMQEEGALDSDGELEPEDEEEKAERVRKERRERMQKIKEAAERRADQRMVDIKREEAENRKNGGDESPNDMMVDTAEEQEVVSRTLLEAITPRARGHEQSESDEEEETRAGDVDELVDVDDRMDRATGLSPRQGKKQHHDLEANQVYDIFDKSDKVAVAAKVVAIARGENVIDKDNFDDKEGYLTFQMGEHFDERYEVKRVLGKGVFSTVLGAQDTRYPVDQTKDKKPVNVAIKIIRNNDMMAKCGAKELEFLKLLAKDGGAEKHHIISLSDDFVHHGHMCLVFEPMAMNLREVIKKFGHNRGINIEGVQVFAKQMLQALKHLRKCKIVHADIKPDNILINERHNAIKICDLGSGSYINECDITPYLVSRWYRAPEITLCLKYDYSIDLWSIACCLYELYTGKVMFPGNSNNDMLRRFMEIKGRFPNKLIKRSMQKMIELGRTVDFTEDFKFMRIMIDKISKKETVKILTIDEKPIKDLMKLLMPTTLQPDQARKVKQLCELLNGALALNPDNRFAIEQCLHHPFIKEPFGYVPKRREPVPQPAV